MTESIWSSAKMLGTLLIKEAAFVHNVENEVKSLADKFKDISSHLKEANVMTDREEEFDRWVSQLRDLAFKAEDVIEVFANIATPCDGCNIFQLIMGFFCQIATLHKLKREMDDINSKLERLLGKMPQMEKIRSSEDGDISHWEKDLASSKSNEDDIVGFEGEADILTSMLTKEEPRGELFVVPIWAQGGAGKTALAQKIYKSSFVKRHFDCVAFASVSPNYDVKNIWLAILAQVKKLTKKEEKELQSEKEVVVQFLALNYLKEKNYLIILDDLWNLDDLEIMDAFPESSQKKCRVLLTTRMEDVARGANPSIHEPLNLRLLNPDESMQLFLKKVYRCSLDKIPHLYKEMDPDMKDLASLMLAKCEGLPIAIVLLGSILSSKRKDVRVWRNKLDRVRSDLANARGLQKVFALSYNELPYQLRSCFLYFGLFPEDSVIDCDKLIRLWVAEGFLEQSGNETMEDVAEECIDGLIQRSMIQVVERRSNGDPQTCRTHDLIRDLVMQEAKKTKFSSFFKEEHLGSVRGSRRMRGSRRIVLHDTSTDTILFKPSSLGYYTISWSQPSRIRPRVVEDIDLVGFQKEADELVTLLTKDQPLGQVCAVSVVGNEGAGKTALARNVYNRSDVKSHFACRAWVYVHPMMELQDFLRNILRQVMMLTYVESILDQEELKRILQYHLRGKSYLIVLDYPFKGEEDWNVITSIFPKPVENQKCRVLLTTYNQTIAYRAFGSTDSIWLWHLREEESLNLFLKTVFQCSQDEIAEVSPPKYMINMARNIVQNCGGVPLAIALLGGLLSMKGKLLSEWADVLEKLNRRRKNESVIEQVVVLCYEDLPDFLRSCIRAFTVEQIAAIEYDTLIQLWVAQGFLKSRDNKSMSEVASDCLEELIQRKLIHVATWTSNGYPETYRTHNLIRDFLIAEEANKAEFSNGLVELEGNLYSVLPGTHTSFTAAPPPPDHLPPKTFNLLCFLGPFKFIEFQNHVYSILSFSKNPQFCIKQFNLVRVLDLEGAENVEEIPKEIRNLTLLRYLSLRGTRVKLIPPWIAYLLNLQTLDAPGSKIPIDTLKLNKLRHLFAHSFYPTDMSHPIDSYSLNFTTLEHLHTLELDIRNWVTSGLEGLRNLRVLRLRGCNTIELIRAIANLTRLKILSLTQAAETFSVHLPSFTYHKHLDEMVLKMRITGLPNFPAQLTYLMLEYCIDNEVDPISTLQELPYLKKLRLRLIDGSYFGDVRMNCCAGGFPELEDLYISVRCPLQYWTVEQEALRSLRVLRIKGGYRLGKLPDGLKHLPKLKELIITGGADVTNSLVHRKEEWDKLKDKRPYIKYMDDITISLQMETDNCI